MIKSITADCSPDTMDAKSQDMILLTCWGGKDNFHTSILYSVNTFYKTESEIKIYSERQKLKRLFPQQACVIRNVLKSIES